MLPAISLIYVNNVHCGTATGINPNSHLLLRDWLAGVQVSSFTYPGKIPPPLVQQLFQSVSLLESDCSNPIIELNSLLMFIPPPPAPESNDHQNYY